MRGPCIALTLALTLTVLSGGCSADDELDGAECFRIEDCGSESVCFLARCVDPAFTLTEVRAEASPPRASGLLEQQLEDVISLNEGFQELRLRATVELRGIASAGNSAVAGVLSASSLLDSDCSPPIPGRRVAFNSAPTANGGYVLRAPTGRYRLAFTPSDSGLPPLDLDNDQPCGTDLGDGGEFDIDYPPPSSRVRITGRLRASENVSTGVEGASVSAVGIDVEGRMLRSTTTLSDAEGSYELVFSSAVISVDVVVGPGERRLVPDVRFSELEPDSAGALPTQTVGLEAPFDIAVTLTGDGDDDQAVSITDALLVYRGDVGAGTLSVSTNTLSSQLPPGRYELTVVPRLSQPFALAATEVTVESDLLQDPGAPLEIDLELPRRIPVSGRVTDRLGNPVEDARVVFRSRQAPVVREFITTSSVDGTYAVSVDPSVQESAAEYEVTVEPPPETGLPLLRQLVRVESADQVIELSLAESTFVFGEALDPDGRPIADALLLFFSRQLADDDTPVLVGTALAGSNGEFVLPLPVPEAGEVLEGD